MTRVSNRHIVASARRVAVKGDAIRPGGALESLQRRAEASPIAARAKRLQGLADGREVVQGVFHPVPTTTNAHVRAENAWNRKAGRKIAGGTEIVADRDDVREQVKRNGDRVSWTKAVNVRPYAWDNAVHSGQSTFVRTSSLGPDIVYPVADPSAAPPGRRLTPLKTWSPATGAYTEVEPSVSTPGASIIKRGPRFLRLMGNAEHALDQDEKRQIDGNVLKAYLRSEVRSIMRGAATGRAWQSKFASDDNIEQLVFAEKGSKALRFNEGIALTQDAFVNWYNWLPGPFQRIRDGADFTVRALDHWQDWLYPGHSGDVKFRSIRLSGSDLHEEGLGAIFLSVAKPNRVGPAPYTNKKTFDLVFKSEEKQLEQALFGTRGDSLAHQVNDMAGLGADRMIRTFNMQTAANYGSLIELVKARQLDKWGADTQDPNSAMREAMVFAFMTGLSDLHYENVLWDQSGMPYFIDADNALNNGRLTFATNAGLRNQSGFAAFNQQEAADITDKLENDADFGSRILAALKENDPTQVQPVLRAVQATFAGKSGRVVPLFTSTWANALKMEFIRVPDGQPADDWQTATRWGVADGKSRLVEAGGNGPNPGLEGEAGIAAAGRMFDRASEKRQIKADFDRGQIPFYVYDYTSGHVSHNGDHVWNGKPLAEALQTLFAKYPGQPQ